jgi:type IV pilus assembly protein PilV
MRLPKSNAGFTMLEVLITIAVLAVGILTSAGLAQHVIQGNDKSAELSAATVIAQNVLEQYQNSGYFGVQPLAASSPIVTTQGSYTVTATITDGTPNFNMVEVDVNVAWTDGIGHTASASTILSRPGGQ